MSILLSVDKEDNFDTLINAISLKINEPLISSYLSKIFDYLSNGKQSLNTLTFYNWTKLPLFLSVKLYNTIKPTDKKKINKDSFVTELTSAYSGSISNKMSIVFLLIDFNRDQIIFKEDARIVAEQYHSMNNAGDLLLVYQIIDDFFGRESSLNFDQFKHKIYHLNSDLFFLIYAFMSFHRPFDNNSLQYFYREILKKDDEINIKDDMKHLKQLAVPSENLLHYLMDQFNINFKLDSEMDELDDFESCVIKCKKELNQNIQFVNILNIFRKDNNKSSSNEDKFTVYSDKKPKNPTSSIGNMSTTINPNQSYFSDYNACSSFKLHDDVMTPNNNQSCYQGNNSSFQLNNKYSFTIYSNTILKNIYFKQKIDIIGNDIYVIETVDCYYIIPIKDIEVKLVANSNREDDKIKSNHPIQLISAIGNTIQYFTFYFDQKRELKAFMDIVNSKTNYVSFSKLYQIDKMIGKGGFGTVFKAMNKSTNQIVAIKVLEKNYESNEDMIFVRQEQNISNYLINTPHENIATIYEVIESIDYVYIIQEYLEQGTLSYYLKQDNKMDITDAIALDLILQLSKGIAFMSLHGIVHRDIKLENIMIKSIDEGNKINIKLIDFGFSVLIGKNERLTDLVGTLCYLSPEISKKESYSKCVDVWAFGVVLYYLLNGDFPLNSKANNNVNNSNATDFRKANSLSQRSSLIKLTNACLEKQHEKRPTIEGVVDIIEGIIKMYQRQDV